jgi:hypothetical protein
MEKRRAFSTPNEHRSTSLLSDVIQMEKCVTVGLGKA